ncbi:MAG TPA: DUF4230 domain-containing protein [Acidobacteriaceae bacterium]|nr:DUF4230 domain-containing protein [Acidobacteriaceae bacterium]
MPATANPAPLQRSRTGPVLLALLLGLIVGAAALALFVHQATTGVWNTIATRVTGRPLSFDISQPAVVSRIQRLERLETVTYTMDKIVEGDRTSDILPDFLVGDKLLLLVHGQAIAGVDLSQLEPSDVAINGKSITVHLPPAQIFVTALDDSKTRVYSRNTGWFVQADPNLESEVRDKAQQELRSSALAAGILTTAQKNADSTLTKLLLSFGFTQVHVD